MIYLDVINVFGTESSITCAGGARIFDKKPTVKKYMRVRDDRFPGEEMLIPIENLEDETVNQAVSRLNEEPLALMSGAALTEPF